MVDFGRNPEKNPEEMTYFKISQSYATVTGRAPGHTLKKAITGALHSNRGDQVHCLQVLKRQQDVVPNAREVLIWLYKKTLNEIKAVPEDEGYRKAVESFTTNRLRVCEEEEDWEQIEKKLACGQMEELIEEAQDDLTLISKMIEWDPCGVPDDYECEVIENDAPVPKHVPLHRPGPLPEEFFKTLEAITSAPKKDKPAIAESTASKE
ncbi:probable NADH dehydrogenase [ubiquinone] 1 alpha subcomplex subunit 5, mitochondrial [Papaver somniferum]|uniref:probable NADH dehydrogenase [ubiquinone] 1 alpha subcomplex subunit 5, mitochondrial n=1 Tax=Papaver somniferum TaxID=3469 RepID=UPI000E6F6444|nr:probable NADH dehydrogenase [ubiquinone] 1 alpha subcomplex subunit 5, mitochondrial [Papaver somniferum]